MTSLDFRYVLLITLITFGCGHASAGLVEHLDLVTQNCQGAKTLLIKKSLLEIKRTMNCREHFTEQLLKDCSNLSCSFLIGSFQKNIQVRSGAVVGE
jgi:hypothetical protein